MNVKTSRITYIFCLFSLFISIASTSKAQEVNDELKKQLKQSALNPKMNQSKQMFQPFKLETQKEQEVLRVSPTTQLPTRLDQFVDINSFAVEKANLNLQRTNSAPITTRPSGMDFDPVRAIQKYKARKRKIKVDRIVRAYSME